LDFINLVPSFGSPVLTILAFIVALSVIVAIHEYGHYIVGRWSGIHAEVFSVGFGPVVWSRTDKRGTQWQIAALPLGGYVKFLGDSNAASVGADADAPQGRNTMLGAPLWARAATVAAGPLFNFILSLLVFAGLLLATGQARSPLTVAELPDWPAERAQELRPGDRVLRIEGVDLDFPDGFSAAVAQLPSEPALRWEVLRDGTRLEVQAPHPTPTLVDGVVPRSAAARAGLRSGDVILRLDGVDVFAFRDMVEIVESSDGSAIALEIWRDGETLMQTLTPRPEAIPQEDGSMADEFKLGIRSTGLFFEPETGAVGLWEAISLGAQQVWYIITQSLNGLKHMIIGAISTCNLSGPVGIAETAGSMASEGVMSFISFIAILSTAVGLLNLFPIPILDGGHLVFHAYEAVTGRPPSDGALRILMAIGLALIGTLMVFAIGNDLFFCR